MECSQIPAADLWDEASGWQLQQYRQHAASCRNCRRRVLKEAPHQLLFELEGQDLPPDFWLGFWQSLRTKLNPNRSAFHFPISLRSIRWAAAVVFAGLLIFQNERLEDLSSTDTPRADITFSEKTEYPLIEELQSPTATYYIFQPDKNEKIVMVFDPEMEL